MVACWLWVVVQGRCSITCRTTGKVKTSIFKPIANFKFFSVGGLIHRQQILQKEAMILESNQHYQQAWIAARFRETKWLLPLCQILPNNKTTGAETPSNIADNNTRISISRIWHCLWYTYTWITYTCLCTMYTSVIVQNMKQMCKWAA